VSGNGRTSNAKSAGTVTLGELTVHRLVMEQCVSPEPACGPPKDRAEALAVLRRAVELGVNFIDTADSYGPEVNEELIAERCRLILRTSSSRPRAAGFVPDQAI